MAVRLWRRLWRDINRDPRFTTLPGDYRAIYLQLMVELDDEGRLPRVPDLSLVEQVADLVHFPTRVVAKGLPKLAERGLLSLDGDEVYVPKFPRRQGLESFDGESQQGRAEGPKTAAERAKAYRERKRERDGERHETSRDARDERHETSRDSERDASRVSPTPPSQKSEDTNTDKENERDASRDGRDETRDGRDEVPQPSAGAPPATPASVEIPESGTERKKAVVRTTEKVRQVFAHWQQVMNTPRSVLDAKRARVIHNAIERHGLEDCKRAIDGCFESDFHMNRPGGRNESGKKYNNISLILRDSEHVEQHLQVLDAKLEAEQTRHEEQARTEAEANEPWTPDKMYPPFRKLIEQGAV